MYRWTLADDIRSENLLRKISYKYYNSYVIQLRPKMPSKCVECDHLLVGDEVEYTNYARILCHLLSIVVITFLPFFPLLRPSIAIEPNSPSIMADPIPIENTSTNVIVTILIIPTRSYFCLIDTDGIITVFLLPVLPLAIL